MKNFHKNKRKGEMTPPPHLNLTISSLGVVSHHQHTKNKENKIKNNRTPLNNKITHIYKLTLPETCRNQPSNTTNHNTTNKHNNTKTVIIATNGSQQQPNFITR